MSASVVSNSSKLKQESEQVSSLFNLGKYKGILISVALFILLDASVMGLNFYTSFQIADDAVSVNLAGRQRMLSQRIAKTLYILNSEDSKSPAFKEAAAELKSASNLFDLTLIAFESGGETLNANKVPVRLTQVTDLDGAQSIRHAKQIWQPYKLSIDQALAQIDKSAQTSSVDALAEVDPLVSSYGIKTSLDSALSAAKASNLSLLNLMNDLTLSLEKVATSKATRLRSIQTVGIVLAIINFLIILLHFLRQLRESDRVLERARNETAEILYTVNEGLFLIGQDLIIGEQHSAKLPEILGVTKVAGYSFRDVLENMVSDKDAETARGFIGLLFDKKIKEKLIGDLNPLNLVQVNVIQPSGGFVTKYLSFTFARSYSDGEILHVLVTVQDITEKVILEKALDETKKYNESQIEMLTGLLHTHPQLLQEFIANSFECFNRINNVLRQPAKSQQLLREKITQIFREIHNFKGEAASLKLNHFEHQAHAFESSLEDLRNKSNITGNDYLVLAVQLESLISYTQQVEILTRKLALLGSGEPSRLNQEEKSVAAEKSIVGGRRSDGFSHLPDFVQNIALRNGKVVRLVMSGLSEIQLAPAYEQQLKEICIQLLRNAITHGIETPVDRELSEKNIEGRIDLRLAKISDNEMELTVMDDGNGIDYDAIREKAYSSGRWSENEIDGWDNKRLLSLIFHEGFSTAKEITKDAGRGVGMEAVMNHVVEHRGKIIVASRKGRYCKFVINLPIVPPTSIVPPNLIESPTVIEDPAHQNFISSNEIEDAV